MNHALWMADLMTTRLQIQTRHRTREISRLDLTLFFAKIMMNHALRMADLTTHPQIQTRHPTREMSHCSRCPRTRTIRPSQAGWRWWRPSC